METNNRNFSRIEYEGEQVLYCLRVRPIGKKYSLFPICSVEYTTESDLEKMKAIANLINESNDFRADVMYRKGSVFIYARNLKEAGSAMRNEDSNRTNWFDDGVLDDDRVRRVIRGRRRYLHLREYNRGEGDWETLCRSIALLKDFYKPQGAQVAFADGIVHAANVCLSLSPRTSRIGALARTWDIEMLDRVIYAPAMVAWCAVCHVKGATCYEMCRIWDGNEFAQTIIKIACRCFDDLSDMRYTDEDLARMSQQQQQQDKAV